MATVNCSAPDDVKRAFNEALRGLPPRNGTGHHLFDTLYHAVAIEAGGLLVTADERYFNKAQPQGRIVRLEEYDVAP